MTKTQIKQIKQYLRNIDATDYNSATELAEEIAYELGLEAELDDETSELWDLTAVVFWEDHLVPDLLDENYIEFNMD